MKARRIFGFLIVAFLLTGLSALAQTAEDIKRYPNCKYCGMDREKFNYSRMLTVYSDGSEFGSCSLHCAAVDLAANIGKAPQAMKVADYNTKNLIDAEKAYWVMGGDKPGVMTRNGKWAFEKERDARAFIKENHGKLAGFEDVMKAAYEDMYADLKIIREKRAKMQMMKRESKP